MGSLSSSWEVSESHRFAIYHALLAQWTGKGFPYGAINEIANKFGVSRWTVRRYWKLGQDAEGPEHVAEAIKTRKKGRVGRKRISPDVLKRALKALPKRRRRTFRHVAKATGISIWALWNALKRRDIKRRYSVLRPRLTAANKVERLRFVLSFINKETNE